MFGEGAVGGAVNYLSKSPDATARGDALFSIGAWDSYRLGLGWGGPLTAGGKDAPLTGRFDYSHNETAGYVDRNAQRYDGGAAALGWQATPDLKLTFNTTYLEDWNESYYGNPVVYDGVVNTTIPNAPVEVRSFVSATDRMVNPRVESAARRTNYNILDNYAKTENSISRLRAELRVTPNLDLRNETYFATQLLQVAQPRDQHLESRHAARGAVLVPAHLPRRRARRQPPRRHPPPHAGRPAQPPPGRRLLRAQQPRPRRHAGRLRHHGHQCQPPEPRGNLRPRGSRPVPEDVARDDRHRRRLPGGRPGSHLLGQTRRRSAPRHHRPAARHAPHPDGDVRHLPQVLRPVDRPGRRRLVGDQGPEPLRQLQPRRRADDPAGQLHDHLQRLRPPDRTPVRDRRQGLVPRPPRRFHLRALRHREEQHPRLHARPGHRPAHQPADRRPEFPRRRVRPRPHARRRLADRGQPGVHRRLVRELCREPRHRHHQPHGQRPPPTCRNGSPASSW
jgi:hypothetical protein